MKEGQELAMSMLQDSVNYCLSECCGKCIACRIGSQRLAEIIARMDAGQSLPWDIPALQSLSQYMMLNSACGTGKVTGKTIASLIPALAANA